MAAQKKRRHLSQADKRKLFKLHQQRHLKIKQNKRKLQKIKSVANQTQRALLRDLSWLNEFTCDYDAGECTFTLEDGASSLAVTPVVYTDENEVLFVGGEKDRGHRE